MIPEEKLIVDRLKATFTDVDEMQKVFDIVTKTLALREAELSQAKALLARAADALQDLDRFAFYCWSCRNEKLPEFIAELRKAAE